MSKLKRLVLGHLLSNGKPLVLNLTRLIVSRALIQASSGSGKSYLIRRLLEITYGKVQQIIIDVEGEFGSLREKHDYIYAAKVGGDATTDPRGAALLAERLLELKTSAILDVFELHPEDRILFVKLFLDAMVNARKALWHPVLVIIDEAHHFCPEGSKVASSDAVMALCSKGRKRGFCAVLATQRISKLHKDAAAECLNKFVGRTSLDVDQKRAGDDLGFAKPQRRDLRMLHPGEFYAYGPAVAPRDIVQFKGGEVKTTHPKAGGRIRFVAPPPTRRIKALLPRLADLPAEAERTETTKRTLARSLSEALAQLATLQKKVNAPPLVKEIKVITPSTLRRIGTLSTRVEKAGARFAAAMQLLHYVVERLALKPPTPPETATSQADAARDLSKLPAHMRMLAVVKAYPGADATKIGALAQLNAKRVGFRQALSRNRQEGWIAGDRDAFTLTEAGMLAARDLPVPPVGAIAVEYWRRRLGGGVVRQVFDAVLAAGVRGISKDEIGRTTEVDTSLSTFRLAISKLKHFDLVNGDSAAFHIKTELL